MTRSVQRPVDGMFRNRHERAIGPGVESPSRAAGGFPTLGGGVRVLSCIDTADGTATRALVAAPGQGGV